MTVRRVLGTAFLLATVIVVIYLSATGRISSQWLRLINRETPSVIFILLFLVLPLVGFPISVFLVLLGVKFEIGPAIAILFATMAFHMAVIFPMAKHLMRPLLEKALQRSKQKLPQFSDDKKALWPGIVFMAVPGLSYWMKNYIFSLSGISFRLYFLIGWLTQAVMGIPVVLAGNVAMERHLGTLALLLALVVIAFAAGYYLNRKKT